MSETNKPHNQDPTVPPEGFAFSDKDLEFISDFTEVLGERLTSAADADSRMAWADRLVDIGSDYIAAKEGSRTDAEPIKLVFLTAALASPISPETFREINIQFGENPLLSDEEKSRIAQMATAARGHRNRQGTSEEIIADEMSRVANVEIGRITNESESNQGSPNYKLALKAFQFGASIFSEAATPARNSLQEEMRVTPAPQKAMA